MTQSPSAHGATLAGAVVGGGGTGNSPEDDQRWVSVTWMPHTTLSQTSHVCLCVRSAHASLDDAPWCPRLSQTDHTASDETAVASAAAAATTTREWKVRVGVYGIAGLPLSSLSSHTPAAPVRSRKPQQRRSLTTPTPVEKERRQDDDIHDGEVGRQREPTTGPNEDEDGIPRPRTPWVSKATHDCWWDEFVELPIRWRDLPRDAYLLFEVLGRADQMVYQTAMPLFSRYGRLCTGLRRLRLGALGGSPPPDEAYDDRNPGLWPLRLRNDRDEEDCGDNYDDPIWEASRILDQLERFEERGRAPPSTTERLHTFGQTQSVPWLDDLHKRRAQQLLADVSAESHGMYDEDAPPFLIVELPEFEIPIMHEETFYPVPQQGASGAVTPLDLCSHRKRAVAAQRRRLVGDPSDDDDPGRFDPLELVPFVDYENEHDNPVEDKYRTLAHDLLRGLVDPALKPDREQRDRLAAIIDSPSHHPTREEKDLLWRFRFSLVDNRRALTKFLLAVDWSVESEVVQAAELLEQWRKRSPIEVTDALKLLGKHVAFQTNLVRAYAIDTLAAAPDSELRLYLLQLVQALKYENVEVPGDHHHPSSIMAGAGDSSAATAPPPNQSTVSHEASLATFLINRAAGNMQLANYLYWYLKVELQNPTHGARYREVFNALRSRLSDESGAPFVGQHEGHHHHTDESGSAALPFKSIVDSVSKLGSSLRGGDHPGGGVGGERDRDRAAVAGRRGRKHGRTMWEVLVTQDEFITGVMDIQQRCRDARGKKDAKEAQLRSLLSEEGYGQNPRREPVPLPSAPHVLVNGVRPETAKMFKSALYPAVIEFYVEATVKADDSNRAGGSDRGGRHQHQNQHQKPSKKQTPSPRKEDALTSCKVFVKTGDDLRQDQLVIMMIQLMDGLLKRAALDLCLTPYSIIAMSPTSGLMEFVDQSIPISQILAANNNSILQFFQSESPQRGAKYDVRPDVMSTYVRSCAGYCVITFLMGVGDRHLDNILLRATGHLFHIDFGFIFGRDPKPLPPAFRLTREMVDGMGGVDSAEYRQFRSLACQAYNALRKSAGLVLNLLHLMSDAGIEDLSNNPSADAEGVVEKVEERFRLDLTDDQAERYFIGLINDCLAAIAPRVMDVFHSFSVARR